MNEPKHKTHIFSFPANYAAQTIISLLLVLLVASESKAQEVVATANLPAHRPQNGYSLPSKVVEVKATTDCTGDVGFLISIPDHSAEGYRLNGTLHTAYGPADKSLKWTDVPIYISGTIVVNGKIRIPLTEVYFLLGSDRYMERGLGAKVLANEGCCVNDDCKIKSLALENFRIARSDRIPGVEGFLTD